MCGIAGFCNRPENWKENILKMNNRMIHRGPDAGDIWASKDACMVLGHRRLSIVDLSPNGSQPMHSQSGRFVCVYNGEIYNHKELRNKLLEEKKVDHFRGTSDTEVLLEAIEAYGVKDAIGMCKGMFALAIFDKQTEKLTLVRDRIGEKPLYYGFVNGSFIFASDLGSISVIDGFNNEIDKKVLQQYFILGYIPAPYSIYKNIYKLEPGCMLEMSAPYQTYVLSEYWSVRECAKRGQEYPFKGSRKEATDELERLLKQSIRDQMVADVPVGAFLSAGIDSTTVVALMQAQSDKKIRTFTIGMEDPKYNEAVRAKEIAAHLGTDHTELYISEDDAKTVIPKLPTIFSEPFADSSQIPTYLVSRLTRKNVTVSLSGDGGDELFCGYETYFSIPRNWKKIKWVPSVVRDTASKIVKGCSFVPFSPHMQAVAYQMTANSPEELYKLMRIHEPINLEIALEKNAYVYQLDDGKYNFLKNELNRIMLMDMKDYHPNDILVKVDRTSMAVSLESRIPMLDKDVVEFAMSLPMEYKRSDREGKLVLKDVLYRYVPEELMNRPKTGFSIPIAKWLREPELRDWAEALIDKKMLRQQNYLNEEVVWRMWTDFIDRGIWRNQIWYILMFQQWLITTTA